MAKIFKTVSEKAKGSFNKFAEREDTKATAKWAKDTSIKAGDSAKKFSKTQLGKQMLIPAVIGAVLAIPIPIIGPVFGALVGAAWGYYNYMSKNQTIDIDGSGVTKNADKPNHKDIFTELAKLDILRRSGALSEDEFTAAKEQLLRRT